jgi:hypothetical protein
LSDEFTGGIWWVPADKPGIVRNASPKECADEIMRLRSDLVYLSTLAEEDHNRIQAENDRLRRLLAAIIETDERGQGLGYAEAMDAAAKAIRDQSLK